MPEQTYNPANLDNIQDNKFEVVKREAINMPWYKRYFHKVAWLKGEIDRLTAEQIEFLNKMREINEEKEMVKKLARTQAQEIKDLLDRACTAEEKYKITADELKLLKEGLVPHGDDVMAVTVVKVKDKDDGHAETFAPMILTLDSSTNKVLKREMHADTDYTIAVNGAKICFMKLFDDQESH